MAECVQIGGGDPGTDEEEIDPRVQVELDNLNGASEIINHLEILHADATTRFRSMNEAAITELKRLRKALGKSVDKSRPFYEARKQARQIQLRTQEAARAYQRANSLYEAAKETIALAEQRLTSKDQHELDPAWQEMLNHAIIKVYDAEKDKSRTEVQHRALAASLAASEREVSQLGHKFTSSIVKARPYFERRQFLEETLEEQKLKISDLASSIHSAKQNYRCSLNNLEAISEEIHQTRRQKKLMERLPPREPCVGAENDDILTESQLDINLDTFDTLSITSSQTGNSELPDDDSLSMKELRHTLQRCHDDPLGACNDSHHGNELRSDGNHGNGVSRDGNYGNGVRRDDLDGNSNDFQTDIPLEIVIPKCQVNGEVRDYEEKVSPGNAVATSNVSSHSNEEISLHPEVAVLETHSTTFLPGSSGTNKAPLSPTSVFSVEQQFFVKK